MSGSLLVLKFGGTSLATPRRMRNAARRVRHHLRAGRRVVVVVSASGSATDSILRWHAMTARVGAAAPSKRPRPAPAAHNAEAAPTDPAGARERDRALASGEDRAAALLAATLASLGVPAISLRGGEAGLAASGAHGNGALHSVHTAGLRALLSAGVVPVVAGFQATREDGETVTLGRGASDLTAVALAAALDGAECHIVTDVDGVYEADPRTRPDARRHDHLSHEALVRIVEGGARVVHPEAARHARAHGVPLRIHHFRQPPRFAAGTRVVSPALRVSAGGVRTIRIALAGCGVVNGELARVIAAHGSDIEARHGVRLQLTRVLVRRAGMPRPVPSALLTTDVEALLADRADVVVEAIGGVEPARRIARATLARGARFVTANKALIAQDGAALAELCARHDGSLDFEAAVGAGIPIVRVLRDALAHAPVRRVSGILNGTCNHVLTALGQGVAFDDAVREAQRLGFAEADPTRDLDGSDAADKLAILAWLAYGVGPNAVAVRRTGLTAAAAHQAQDAVAVGQRLRLIASCERTVHGVIASVEPIMVAADSLLGRTEGEENRILLELEWGGIISLGGPGAGAASTASALLGDVLRSCAPLPCAPTNDAVSTAALPDDALAAVALAMSELPGETLSMEPSPCSRAVVAYAGRSA
jgi:homoserine dehydrogenase